METSSHVPHEGVVGDLAIEFLHTKFGVVDGPPEGPRPLNDYADLVAWARLAAVLDAPDAERLGSALRADPAAARAAYDRAIRFRTALDTVLRAVIDDRQPSPEALMVVRTDAADALAAARLEETDGAFGWTWDADTGLERPIWPVVHAAVELLTAGPLDRVKACALCQYLFIDRSKNRSRRWCSMAACGTSEKMRRYTERRAAKRLA
jgi:predicted RNA-binding Zn ribbon-like protein